MIIVGSSVGWMVKLFLFERVGISVLVGGIVGGFMNVMLYLIDIVKMKL